MTDIWNNCHRSVCSLQFLNAQNERIGSGSGFKVREHLITNNHVFAIPEIVTTVIVTFVGENGHTVTRQKSLTRQNFLNRLIIGLPEHSWDYAILRFDDDEFTNIPSLVLQESSSIQIGSAIAVLGFPFEHRNLSLNQGILSSRYVQVGVKYMQLDANVNQGNSGGPLIDAETGNVVGVVTRKHTGLADAFKTLSDSFDHNVQILRTAAEVGGFFIGEIDLITTSIVVQEQLKIAMNQMKRSANVGIGYAYELDPIKDFFDNLD